MEEEKKNLHRVKFLDYKIQNGVTFYSISVTTLTNSESWIFEARYKQMLEVNNQISSNSDLKLPTFPPKKWPGNLNLDFISQRQKSLENYFNNLLKIVNIEKTPVLKTFLYQNYKKKDGNKAQPPPENIKKDIGNPIKEKEKLKEVQPINPFSIKTTFEKIVEDSKFVDLNAGLNSPEEEEIKEKREKFKAFNHNLKINFPKKDDLPSVKSLNPIEEINKLTFSNKSSDLIQLMNECMDIIVIRLGNMEEFSINSQMIHNFQ